MSTHFLGVKNGMYNHYTPSNINADYMNLLKGQYSRDVLINRYDNGMLEADDVIRKIFLGLERKGYLGDSIVFIIGDHGEGLGEHKHFGHDRFVYQEDIRIPMLIYDSEGHRYANLEFASQLDVAPTIIDRLGLNIPSSWEGKSLLNQAIKSYSYQQTRGGPYIYAVLYREGMNIYKYIRWERNRDTGKVREELYELNSDPAELRDLLPSADPELIQKMGTKAKEVFGPDAS
jgi:arylsulfatase A-like enzyme